MNIAEIDFRFSWPDHVPVVAQIDWTLPSTHDVLFSGLLEQDETAYFYAVISLYKRKWMTHYIGKVYAQCSSKRHRAADHVKRLNQLRELCPDRTFHLTLGTPKFADDTLSPDAKTIDAIEGLLIYSNWTIHLTNKRKIDSFSNRQEISLENVGFTKHVLKRSAYGVFSSSQ
jgi:hypothetical protein